MVSRLPKGSLQWTKAIVVSQRKHYSNQNPVLFFDNATKVLYLFHSQQDAKKEYEYSGEGQLKVIVRLSVLRMTVLMLKNDYT